MPTTREPLPSRSERDDEVDARDVVAAVRTVHKLIRQYGFIALAIIGTGGGAAIFTIPHRLAKVEQDHVTILRHQARMEAGQNWMVCVIAERSDSTGDPSRCNRIRPDVTERGETPGFDFENDR